MGSGEYAAITAIIAVMILLLFFGGDPDLMDALMEFIGQHQ